jgi:hypothetical protein
MSSLDRQKHGAEQCRPNRLPVIPQHQLLRVGVQIHLLVHPLGHRVTVQVVIEQRQGHDQWHQTLPIVLDKAQELPTDQRQALSSLDR